MNREQLKRIIERSGLKTKDFAERLGISAQQLNNMFGNADVKSGTLERVAEIMGVSVATLYGDIHAPVAIGNTGNNSVNGVGVPYDALGCCTAKDSYFRGILRLPRYFASGWHFITHR